jgi:AcrR family transcriptional regulator
MPRLTEQGKSENRQRLLDAAAAEFARRGLEEANINEISLAAGFAKGTVYNHFDSKQELFLAVVEEACELAAAGAREVPAGAPTRERLCAALAGDVEWARSHEPFARVLVREVLTPNPRLYPRVLEAAAPFISRIREILADGVKRGEVRSDLAVEELALVFVGFGDLALIQHWGSDGAWPRLEEIPNLITSLFLEGAAPRPGREASGG